MADVCLMLEGTYPYVSGGVSGWVHQLITRLPNTSFHLVFIGARSDELLTLRYKLPSNVVGLQEVFLFDEPERKIPGTLELNGAELRALTCLHRELHHPRPGEAPLRGARFEELRSALRTLFPDGISERRLLRALGSRGVWKLLLEEYGRTGLDVPFISFFYTWRSTHLPIYRALSQRYPRARVYHALCTGYAGLAAAQASVTHKGSCLITEHGVYAHERAIEISQSEWVYERQAGSLELDDPTDAFRQWWIRTFRNLSRIAYGAASETVTLYEGNRARQLRDGAIAERSTVVANGVTQAFRGARREHPSWAGPGAGAVFRLGFVGRVVSIKDIKMLIKAVRAVHDEYPALDCQIVGPDDEEPGYSRQCLELAGFLGLSRVIRFVGRKDVAEVYPALDCLCLTSISEAQPLAVLEANVAGVPVVSTRVGSVPELLEGASEPDRLLGPSGLISEIGDSERMGAQILELIRDPGLWERMSLAGIERVSSFYSEREMISRYDILYRKHLGGLCAPPELREGRR